jgi:hypothetical protein
MTSTGLAREALSMWALTMSKAAAKARSLEA